MEVTWDLLGHLRHCIGFRVSLLMMMMMVVVVVVVVVMVMVMMMRRRTTTTTTGKRELESTHISEH